MRAKRSLGYGSNRLVLNATKDTGAYLNELANAEKALFDPFGVVTAADGVRQGNAGDAVIGILSSITRVRGLTSTIGKSAGLSRLAEEAGRSVAQTEKQKRVTLTGATRFRLTNILINHDHTAME